MIQKMIQNRREKKELLSKMKDLPIEWDIDEWEPFVPQTPTIDQLMDMGLSRGAAESFVFMVQYPGSEAMEKDMEAGNTLDRVKMVQRAALLPGFFKAMSDVTKAIFEKQIDPNPDAVKKTIPRLTRDTFRGDADFYRARNELLNIASGAARF